MPLKKKGTGKKSAKVKKSAALLDGLTKDELSKEQMIDHIVMLREELDREREERNYFQLERDQVRTFWDVTKEHLEEAVAQLRNEEKKIEEDEGRHLLEIKVYKQKMKHLLCEHQNTIAELQADRVATAEAMRKEQAQLERELLDKMAAIRTAAQQFDIENLVSELEQRHNEEMAKTKKSCEDQLAETEARYKEKLEVSQRELDNLRKTEIIEWEDQWNSHISALTKDHHEIYDAALALLNQTMERDLHRNDSLKKQIEESKMKQIEKKKSLARILPENERLSKLLLDVQEKTAELQRKMKHPIRKEDAIERMKEKKLSDEKRKLEKLKQKFSELQRERDELRATFSRDVENAQREEDEKNAKLEEKVKDMTDSLEATEAKISDALSASDVDQTALKSVEEMIDSSNKSIRDLQHKIAQISKARQDLLFRFEEKQRALCVPVEQLCVTYSTFGNKYWVYNEF
ncbi:dynein regulatory complex subunit 4 isoform X2 [Syngnathoides biaculeatus]|uniref:dynein regulatory complex subunit 4 isoform X2 n=1 Tax=Syngnathoides biaculeatus TaxID=300417 RepID=UPI002ADDFE21|nr:dynein regulatory complex subunit 4 isoform X2 [Syngnathoides biaculeatus]